MTDPYENLANAIIVLAAKDYRRVLRRLQRFPHDKDSLRQRDSLERFFRSAWFGVLTKADPEALMKKLRLEVM